jgi:hypothetical protein
MVLPGKIAAQGWALAPIAVATRPEGAPLTAILGGKRIPGTEDGPGPGFCGRDHRNAVTAVTASLRKRGGRPGGGSAPEGLPPEGLPPEGRHMAAALESDSAPPFPATAWWWCPPQSRILTR